MEQLNAIIFTINRKLAYFNMIIPILTSQAMFNLPIVESTYIFYKHNILQFLILSLKLIRTRVQFLFWLRANLVHRS